MAWIKVKDMQGKIYTVPESVFKNSYESSGVLVRVEEPKPQKKPKVEVEEVDSEIQRPEENEFNSYSKNKKKAGV